ncbi:MAG: hypothetical protein KZQ93_14710 [Candidatus Thiodiazotropha sp. (ex Monitilora ramsayi)]|nr:hypothetical protein [Candidatus Thiodiazotropha sp. (ex Monitilora ramsayi)]
MEDLEVCPKCGYRTDFDYINKKFRVKRRTNDISYTYDGYCVVSLKFKETCERAHLQGMQFNQLPSDKDYYVLKSTCVVKFDTERRKTRFESKCEFCGNHESIVGSTPAFIKSELNSDICRTDVMFGSGNEKHPMILVSEKAKEVLEREKLNGVLVEEVRT